MLIEHRVADRRVVRHADDIVLGFQHRSAAERFRAELTDRFGQFNL